MINITFPDKSVRKYDSSITGYDLAKSISNSLAKNAICIEINGEFCLLYTSPSPRDNGRSRMPSSA